MANSIDWGEGSANNNIGWGQGAINNSISWGKSYFSSYAGETDIVGNISVLLISDFKTRILADLGTYSAETCQSTTLTNLNNI